jgi:uncharacterized membrane protein
MFCHFCGAQVNPDTKFCPSCGQSLEGAGGAASPKADTAARGVTHAQTGEWISAGWALVQRDLFLWVIIALIYLLLCSAVPLILQGALTAGLHYAFLKRLLGQPIEFGDMFKGFGFFLATLLAILLIGIFTALGALACIIPAFVISAMYLFTYLFIIDRKMDFWPAMQASHEIVKGDYFGYTMFFLALILLQLLGILACIVGILVTIPVMFAAVTVAYRDTVGIASTSLD